MKVKSEYQHGAGLQFPMTAVFTTSVNNVIWFAAVLFMSSAVV